MLKSDEDSNDSFYFSARAFHIFFSFINFKTYSPSLQYLIVYPDNDKFSVKIHFIIFIFPYPTQFDDSHIPCTKVELWETSFWGLLYFLSYFQTSR